MKNKISNEILVRYLQGSSTEEETRLVDEWYSSIDKHEMGDMEEWDEDKMEHDLYLKIKRNIKIASTVPLEYKLPKKSNFVAYSIAAAVIATLMIFGVGFYAKKEAIFESIAAPSFASVTNKGTNIQRVYLSDGSVVWLKPNSTVVYPHQFAKSERKLTLSGEAFFVVEKDPSRPFMITSGKVITKVLGTSFNIRAYEESSSIEVEVLTGKVSVSLFDSEKENVNHAVLLTPNQRVKYIKGETNFANESLELDVKTLAIWQTTNISFDNETVREVIKTLRERFHVKIQTNNANLLNCIVRADFSNQNLPDILELLSKSIDADYKLEGNTFTLEGEGCPN